MYDRERDSRHRRGLRDRDPLAADDVRRQVLSRRQRAVAGPRTQRHGGRLRQGVRVVRHVQHGRLLQHLLLVPRHLHPPHPVFNPW